MKIPYKTVAHKFHLPDFMPETGIIPLYYSWKFSLTTSPDKLWPYVADTSLFNRFIGLAPRSEVEKEGKRWVKTTVLGIQQEWVEEPWTWRAGQRLEYVRHYTKGITRSVRSTFILEPTDQGVDLFICMVWLPPTKAHRLFLRVTEPVIHSKFAAAFESIAQSLQAKNRSRNTDFFLKPNDPVENVNLSELEKVSSQLKLQNLNPAAVDGLINLIKFGDDASLYRIRAIELANKLQIKKRDTISACMQGVREGLLTISWDVVCPHCRGVRLEAKSLGEIPANSECFVCEIDFETDTLESIEVTFHVHPSFRKIEPVLFCSAEPSKKDHIQVQEKIPARSTVQVSLMLKEGRHRLRTTSEVSNLMFEVTAGLPNEIVHWDTEHDPEKLHCGENAAFVLENKTDREKTFILEQLWWKDDILHPVDIFAIQEYQDVFSRESLNSQVRMSLGIQTVMFTDIVNSTGFYSSRGDAAAFNQVRKHFTETFAIVAEHEGTVIKTIGDSVMACFLNPGKALQAAMAIQKAFHPQRQDTSIRLRISLHVGQVIAVHLNQGLDLFGNSVNKAAKLQSCAGSGEIALSLEFVESSHPMTLLPFRDFLQKRTSNIQYKELPLEAQVLKLHESLNDEFLNSSSSGKRSA